MDLKYGIQPFWFWNGSMDDDEMVRQIKEMARQKIKGFMIHPRQGLEIPYLSKAFFEKARLAVNTAKQFDMEVWLYDEFPYPSGVSGGQVMLDHPEFCCKDLTKTTGIVSGGETLDLFAPWGRVVLARAYAIDNGACDWNHYIDVDEYIGTGYRQDVFQFSGLTVYNKKRFFQGDIGKRLCWTAPEGEWKVYIYTEVIMEHFKYFETYIDSMNPEAIKYFIQTTHERYREELGDEFGKTIKGIFTDEITAFPPENPWSPLLPSMVQELHNLNLVQYLPALTEDMGSITPHVRYAYWNASTIGFINSYDKPIYQWCKDNNLLYIGEKPILRSEELAYVHIPGIDTGHQKVGSKADVIDAKYRFNGKIASSAAHFYDKPGVLCEAFHSIGWGETLQDMKWIFDWLAVSGVNWYVIHGFYYSTDGLKKHDAPPSSFLQMPWWENMYCLSEHADKLSNFLLDLKRTVKVLIIDPVTSTWTASATKQAQLKRDFAAMQNYLIEQQLDYYIIDPHLFAQGEVLLVNGVTKYNIKNDSYDLVLLAPMTNLEDCAIEKLSEFAEHNGTIISYACLPYEQIEIRNSIEEFENIFKINPGITAESYWNHKKMHHQNGSCYFTSDLSDLTNIIYQHLDMDFRIFPIDGGNLSETVAVQGISSTGKPIMYFINLSKSSRTYRIEYQQQTLCTLKLAQFESRFVTDTIISTIDESVEYDLNLNQVMTISPMRMNALRIGKWNALLPDGQHGIVDSFPFIDQFERAGFKLPIQQNPYFGCPKTLEFPPISVQYDYCFDWACTALPNSPVFLLMEPGTLLGEWSILINEFSVKENDFVKHEIYMNSNLVCDISSYIQTGKNNISLQIKSEVSYGGIRNPFYIFGDFGVWQEDDRWVIKDSVKTGYIKNTIDNGLPFYAGVISFEMSINDIPTTGQSVRIRISDSWLEDSIRLWINGHISECKICSPYVFDIPAEWLTKENDIRILLNTTLIGLFEGEEFDRSSHRYVSVEK